MTTYWNPAALYFQNGMASPSYTWTFDVHDLKYPSPWPFASPWQYYQPFRMENADAESDTDSDDEGEGEGDDGEGEREAEIQARSMGQLSRYHQQHPSQLLSPLSVQSHVSRMSAARALTSLSSHSSLSFDSTNRPRPSYWRQGYYSQSSPWIRKALVRCRSFFRDGTGSFDSTLILNTLLQYTRSPSPRYYYDLRFNPFLSPILYLPNSIGPVNHLHRVQLATSPPVHQLRLWHRKLPWIITVRSSSPNGILIADVLESMFSQLMIPITAQDYYNAEMTAEDRERIEIAYQIRCNGDLGILAGGVRRIDFLGSHVGFLGLNHSLDGTWEIKTGNINTSNK